MTNSFSAEFLKLLESRYAHDKADMTISDWIIANTQINGRAFSFNRYPFQRQIADDMHPNMDVIKPSQVGMTEIQIRKVLAWLMRNTGMTAIYTMPDEDMFKRVSQGRILPIIQKDQVFQPRPGEKLVRSRSIIQLRDSWLYLTGASEGDATSISADMVMNDEVDLTDQEMLALFNSRLQNSVYKINQRFSTPTYNNFGIDLSYQASDQHQFLCRCDSCRHWQRPDFSLEFLYLPGLPDSVEDPCEIDEKIADKLDIVNSYVKCERCSSPLDLGREDNREWVAKYPSRKHARGYEILPFSTDRLPPSYIITQLLNYRRREAVRRFYNTVLGRAYTGADERLTEKEIRDILYTPREPELPKGAKVVLGIDLGITCHLVLGAFNSKGQLETIHMATIPYMHLINTVKEILRNYSVIAGAVDRLPYTPTAMELKDISNGVIMPVQYTGSREVGIVMDAERKVVDHVQLDRTIAIDRFFNLVKRKETGISGYGSHEYMLIEHLRDMVREEKPEEPAKWIKLTGADHFFHAHVYMHSAIRIAEVMYATDKADNRSTVGFGSAIYSGHGEDRMLQMRKTSSRSPFGALSHGPLG